MYTLETLLPLNGSYHQEHRLNQSDVDMANKYVETIENSRSEQQIQVGDIVEYTTKYGDYYKNAHIESFDKYEDNMWHICEQPYIPFIGLNKDGNNIYCSTSGGAWTNIPNTLKYLGKRKKLFKDWGSCGACGNGSVCFEAEVNVWEYKEPNALYGEYTTKDYNKQYISYCVDECGNPKNGSQYRYFGNGIAFANKDDYNAWLKTYRSVEFKGNWKNQTVVFGYREDNKLIRKDEWYKLNLPIDTRLCNGINPCKVEYDDKNHIIKVYRFTNRGELDWKRYKPYELVRGTMNLQKEIDRVYANDIGEKERLEKYFSRIK